MSSHMYSVYLLTLVLFTVVRSTKNYYLVKIDEEESSIKGMKTKLEKLLGKYVTSEDLTSMAADIHYCPDELKDQLVHNISKEHKLPPDVEDALQKLVMGSGSHQAGSITLLSALTVAHLLMA
ncbi:hypothetical protein PHET_04481 [Paragonimus heterotremus]|uniref:Uncharacterized protein n=1 Tax=Paragonimus heterotremus TaxID=100268 RepID=A0A8J4SQH2_9TREM|nr:hypothetical protein PHET_04481 [Paragonimus heterotremus]